METLAHDWRRRMATRSVLAAMLLSIPLLAAAVIGFSGGVGSLPFGIAALTGGPGGSAPPAGPPAPPPQNSPPPRCRPRRRPARRTSPASSPRRRAPPWERRSRQGQPAPGRAQPEAARP